MNEVQSEVKPGYSGLAEHAQLPLNVDGIPPAKLRYTTPEAAAYLQTSASFLEKFRCYNPDQGPRFIKLGRRVFYTREALDQYLASCEQGGAA